MYKRTGQIIIVLLSLYFIGRIFYNNWEDVSVSLTNIASGPLIISIIIFSLTFFLLSSLWHYLIFGKRYGLATSNQLYLKANLLRYIPGNIWGIGARIIFFNHLGIAKAKLIFFLFYESVLMVLSGGLVFLIFSLFFNAPTYLIILALIMTLVLTILAFKPAFILRLVNLFGSTEIELGTNKNRIYYFLAYIIYWLLSGMATYFLAQSILGVGNVSYVKFSAIYIVSWLIGYLSIITPSGIGVRELTFTYLLSTMISQQEAGLIAIMSRLVFTVGELLSYFSSLLIYKLISQQHGRLPAQ
ncbi:MAG: hypothetical protein UW12_C0023G0008 [Parcubacteria group bacterium GW2011_GWF1_43_9]|nr:MAG: hypothetical protein UW12_C0023G0008 [Parcubacteria group bacterium GW2011_GWF1_43_9]